jgi:hypothetical protein
MIIRNNILTNSICKDIKATYFPNENLKFVDTINQLNRNKSYYKNVFFNLDVIFDKSNICRNMSFENCIFIGNLEFSDCSLSSVDIKNVKFLNNNRYLNIDNLNFINKHMDNGLMFKNIVVDSVRFSEVVSQLDIRFYNSTIQDNLSFDNVRFNYEFQFFNDEKNFYNSIVIKKSTNVEKPLFLIKTKIHKQLNFNNCDFYKGFDMPNVLNFSICFSYGYIYKVMSYPKTTFEKFAIFNNINFKEMLDLSNSFFFERLVIEKCKISNYLDISSSEFKSDLILKETEIVNSIICSNSIILGVFDLSASKSYSNCMKQIGKLLLNETIIKKKAIFHHRVISEVNLNNTKFEALADFYDVEFLSPVRFYKTDFRETTVFSKSRFKELAVFHYSAIEGNMIFRDAEFKKGLNLAPVNIGTNGQLNVFNLNVADFKPNKDAQDIDSSNTAWMKISPSHQRETFRILKDQALKQNNRIESLKWQAREVEAYRKELYSNDKYKCFFIGKEKVNKFILFANRISNQHNENPWRGFRFIFWASIIGLNIMLINIYFSNSEISFSFGLNDFDKKIALIFSNLFKIINITNWNYKPLNIETHWTYIILSIVRIFVGFGIYQTVQAFRKFK